MTLRSGTASVTYPLPTCTPHTSDGVDVSQWHQFNYANTEITAIADIGLVAVIGPQLVRLELTSVSVGPAVFIDADLVTATPTPATDAMSTGDCGVGDHRHFTEAKLLGSGSRAGHDPPRGRHAPARSPSARSRRSCSATSCATCPASRSRSAGAAVLADNCGIDDRRRRRSGSAAPISPRRSPPCRPAASCSSRTSGSTTRAILRAIRPGSRSSARGYRETVRPPTRRARPSTSWRPGRSTSSPTCRRAARIPTTPWSSSA